MGVAPSLRCSKPRRLRAADAACSCVAILLTPTPTPTLVVVPRKILEDCKDDGGDTKATPAKASVPQIVDDDITNSARIELLAIETAKVLVANLL